LRRNPMPISLRTNWNRIESLSQRA
jgi:hypothetical protein